MAAPSRAPLASSEASQRARTDVDPAGGARGTFIVPPSKGAPTQVSSIQQVSHGPFGTDGPLVLEAAAPDGTWTAYCQARTDTDGDGQIAARLAPDGTQSGDAMLPYISLGDRELAGAELLATDPSGRWLIIRQQGSVRLIDGHANTELSLTDLGADTASDLSLYLAHRALAFHPTRPLLAYVRLPSDERCAATGCENLSVVVRSLETGAEVSVELGRGALVRLEFAPGGDALLFKRAVDDTNKNGRLDLPIPLATVSPSCHKFTPIPRFPAWQDSGDAVSTEVSKLAFAAETPRADALPQVSAPISVPGLIAPVNGKFLVRGTDHSLWLEKGSARQLVASAKCSAVVWHVDSERGKVVFVCTHDKPVALSKLQLFDGNGVKDLGLELRPLGFDRWLAPAPYVPFYPGALTAILDVEQAKVVNLLPDDAVVAFGAEGQHGTAQEAAPHNQALIMRGRKLFWLALKSSELRDVGVEVDPLPHVLQSTGAAVVSPYVLDITHQTVLGKISLRPLAVSQDGDVLVATGKSASAAGFAEGPLAWQMAEPLR